MSETLEASVLAAERSRCAAMLANDHDALADLMDERLHFCHATGAVDGRDTYLGKMAAGRIRYVGIAWAEETVTVLAADAAMLTGRMTTDVEVEGSPKRLANRVMTVWNRADAGWRLIAFQSTPITA